MLIVDAYHGREPLWRVFWLYGVLLSTVVTAFFLWVVYENYEIFAVDQLLVVAFVPYTAWLLVSIWRCAFNASREVYGHVARGLTIAWAINATLLVGSVELDLLL